MFSPLPFSPVSGTFPVLLQLPNGQTMPVAIPASITSSSVHIPTTIPVSILLLIFSISDGKIRSWDIYIYIINDATLSQWIVELCCILYQLRNIVNCWVVHVENIRHRTVTLLHMFSHAIVFHLEFNTCRQQLTSVLVLTISNVGCALCYWGDLQPWLPRLNKIMDSEAGLGWDTAGSGPGGFNANRCTTIICSWCQQELIYAF